MGRPVTRIEAELTPTDVRKGIIEALRPVFAAAGFATTRIRLPVKSPGTGTPIAARERGPMVQAVYVRGSRWNSSAGGLLAADYGIEAWFLTEPREQFGILAVIGLHPKVGVQHGGGSPYPCSSPREAEKMTRQIRADVERKLLSVLDDVTDGPSLGTLLKRLGAPRPFIADVRRELGDGPPGRGRGVRSARR